METKICTKCKEEKSLSDFYKCKESEVKSGYRSRCKKCNREDVIEYDKKTGYHNRYQKDWAKTHRQELNEYRKRPEVRIRSFANDYISNRIKKGIIIRQPCALCSTPQGEAHHPDYAQPLLIIWLCGDCHRKVHARLREVTRDLP